MTILLVTVQMVTIGYADRQVVKKRMTMIAIKVIKVKVVYQRWVHRERITKLLSLTPLQY